VFIIKGLHGTMFDHSVMTWWIASSSQVASFYGGTSIMTQVRDLAAGVDVVVGTPGRVIDLINRGKLILDKVGINHMWNIARGVHVCHWP
jgi:superfamily II DNA/RNA helicase